MSFSTSLTHISNAPLPIVTLTAKACNIIIRALSNSCNYTIKQIKSVAHYNASELNNHTCRKRFHIDAHIVLSFPISKP